MSKHLDLKVLNTDPEHRDTGTIKEDLQFFKIKSGVEVSSCFIFEQCE